MPTRSGRTLSRTDLQMRRGEIYYTDHLGLYVTWSNSLLIALTLRALA
jgi:hypothetical protein